MYSRDCGLIESITPREKSGLLEASAMAGWIWLCAGWARLDGAACHCVRGYCCRLFFWTGSGFCGRFRSGWFWKCELVALIGIEAAYGAGLVVSILAIPVLLSLCIAGRRRGRVPLWAAGAGCSVRFHSFLGCLRLRPWCSFGRTTARGCRFWRVQPTSPKLARTRWGECRWAANGLDCTRLSR